MLKIMQSFIISTSKKARSIHARDVFLSFKLSCMNAMRKHQALYYKMYEYTSKQCNRTVSKSSRIVYNV